MKKLVLAVLMVVVLAVPCVADITPEGLFTIEGTYWGATSVSHASPFMWGFYGGKVYACFSETYCIEVSTNPYGGWGTYADFLLFAIVNTSFSIPTYYISYTAYLIPFLGFGFGTGTYGATPAAFTFTKLSDTWTPPVYP